MALPVDSVSVAPSIRRYWPYATARAVIAAAIALWVTFSADHSASFGVTVFGVFAVATALVFLAIAVFALRGHGVARTITGVQAVVTAISAIPAFVSAGTEAALPVLYATVIAWAVITGALELYNGYRARRISALRPVARDWMTTGTITLVLALAFLLVPPTLNQQYGGIQEITGALTASVMVVGFIGAYAAVIAMFVVVAALSLKWSTASARRSPSQTEAAS